jgi:outer membrane protein assembly factor BamB
LNFRSLRFPGQPPARVHKAVLAAFGAAALSLAACTGAPIETSWGEFTLVGQPANILFSFSDRIVLIDPIDGQPVELRDEEGQVRVDDQTGNPRVWDVRVASSAPTHFYTDPIFLDENTLLSFAYEPRAYQIDLDAARVLNPEGTAAPGRVVADPLLADGQLFVPLAEGDLVALDPETNAENWRLDTRFGIWARPLLIDGTLYVTSLDHFIYALDPATGEPFWTLELNGAIAAPPLYADGFLYIGTFGRRIYKITAETGAIVTEYTTIDWVWGTPALVDGVLYTADLAGNVYALRDEGDSFVPVWTPRQVATRGIRATPLVTDSQIIVGSRDRFLYWIDRETGAENFRREMRGEVLSELMLLEPSDAVAVSEPLVIASTLAREELLVAFTLDNGERRWVYAR